MSLVLNTRLCNRFEMRKSLSAAKVALLGLQCKPTKHDLGNGGVEYRNLAFCVPSQEVRVAGHPKYEQFTLLKKWLHPDRSGKRNQIFHSSELPFCPSFCVS